MILNDKPNRQVSRILMNPRPIFSDSSENDLRKYKLLGVKKMKIQGPKKGIIENGRIVTEINLQLKNIKQ
jgi:hypothetical protein